uniref:TRAP-type C4-dicarboxylate transport system, substrate-binding protein n=1 Tax=Marinobacter nauticus TaxID=2743 RepID=A0A455WD33_MARNT|nr:hypothetical protein YBY_20320 [Marinobacter nauticus]
MKLDRFVILAVALCALFLFSLPALSQTFRMNHQMPATAVSSAVDRWFVDEVAKRTGGDVDIQIFWSEGLGKTTETLSLLKNDAIDMAGLSPGYFPGQLPLFTAPNSFPMAIDNVCQANRLIDRLLTEVPGFQKEAAANGIKPLFFHVLNPYYLVSKQPITTLEQMVGVRMRTWGAHMPRMVQAAGGTAVTLGLSEIYEGFSRGVIDAAPFSVDLVETYNIYEVAKHVTEVTLWDGPTWGVWMTQSAWESLSPDHQAVVMEVAAEAQARDLAVVRQAAENARQTLKEKGVTFHHFDAADLRTWQNRLPDFFSEWIEQMEVDGKGDAARQAVAIWREVVDTVECPA